MHYQPKTQSPFDRAYQAWLNEPGFESLLTQTTDWLSYFIQTARTKQSLPEFASDELLAEFIGNAVEVVEERSAEEPPAPMVPERNPWLDDFSLRELDQRYNDGIEVRLLWNQRTDRVILAVNDANSGQQLAKPIDGARARHAFDHPYVYV